MSSWRCCISEIHGPKYRKIWSIHGNYSRNTYAKLHIIRYDRTPKMNIRKKKEIQEITFYWKYANDPILMNKKLKKIIIFEKCHQFFNLDFFILQPVSTFNISFRFQCDSQGLTVLCRSKAYFEKSHNYWLIKYS